MVFLCRRLLTFIPLLFGVVLLSFFFIQLSPGDYFDQLKADPQISAGTIERYKARYHLDQPAVVQFWYWLGSLLQGDLGYSFARRAPVVGVILSHTPATLLLACVSLLLTWGIAVPLGTWQASRHNTLADRCLSLVALCTVSLPGFMLATVLLLLASFVPGMPIGGMTSIGFSTLPWYGKIGDLLLHLLVPTTTLVILGVGSLLRITRASVLETYRKPFILAARARGLPERIIRRQAFINAMNPLITLLGYEFAGLLSGSAIIEIICGWPGLGSVMLEAVLSQDLFLVMGGVMMGSVLLLVGNLLSDVLHSLTDPRLSIAG